MVKRAEDDGLTAHILDLLTPWMPVEARRMFGGTGIFAQGLMIGIIFDDTFYLKDSVDENKKSRFTDFEKEYFEYSRYGKVVNLGYLKAPLRALENSQYMIELAKESYRSALSKKQTTKAKPRIKKKDPPPLM